MTVEILLKTEKGKQLERYKKREQEMTFIVRDGDGDGDRD